MNNGLIYKKIIDVMKSIDAIGKSRDNKGQGYKFRGIDEVYNELHPLLAEHGVFTVPVVLEERSEERTTAKGSVLIYRILKMKYWFYAEDGSSIDCIVVGEGMDSGDKASNKAMSVAHKYAFLQIFAIPTEDAKDPENETPDPIKPKTAPIVNSKSDPILFHSDNISHLEWLEDSLLARGIPGDKHQGIAHAINGYTFEQFNTLMQKKNLLPATGWIS